MELFHFAPTYMENETYKINWLESMVNHKMKAVMLVHTYSCYQEMFETAINMEMKGKPSSIRKGTRGKRSHKIIGINKPNTRGHDRMAHKAAR